MDKEQIINKVAIRLVENTGKLNHGTVSATLTVHEGKIVSVSTEVKDILRKREEVKE